MIDCSTLKKIPSREDLVRIMHGCEETGNKVLENLDLSECEGSNMNFDGYEIRNVAFSRYIPAREEKKKLCNLSFVGAGMCNVSFAAAILERCNFDRDAGSGRENVIEEVDFFFSELSVCRFRNAHLKVADFRYSVLNNCSLSGCRVEIGDFYMCAFTGTTTLLGSKFSYCSLSTLVFEHNCLKIENIDHLVQDDYEKYRFMIGKTSGRLHNPCRPKGSGAHRRCLMESNKLETLSALAREGASVYQALSGAYAGKGFNRDSNIAYKRFCDRRMRYHSIEMRRESSWRKRVKHGFDYLKHMGIWSLGYGYQWWKVMTLFLLLALAGGLYLHLHVPEMDAMEAYARSLNNSLGPQESFAEQVGNFISSSTHSALGLLIVGFLGFILANKVRNNS